jgi:chaperone modulatory protein CbpM
MSAPESGIQVIGIEAACRQVGGVSADMLTLWIERRWVCPPGGERFRPVDLARIRLIMELRHDLLIEDSALELMLPLLDQLYAERARLRRLADLLAARAPAELIEALREALMDDLAAG